MTYIVNDKCIKCKLMDCVEVCPVDCFYEGKNMLVIKPDECIDCGVCEPECPVDAITLEENSNQILDFTREVKNVPQSDKIKIIESLWKIVYSNNNADMYEKNLMRRLSGLLYIEAKTMVDIKEKVKRELT